MRKREKERDKIERGGQRDRYIERVRKRKMLRNKATQYVKSNVKTETV